MCSGNNDVVALNLTREPAESRKTPCRAPMTLEENPQIWMKPGWSAHHTAGFLIRDRARKKKGRNHCIHN